MNTTKVYDYISLYVLFVLALLPISAIATKSTYLLFISVFAYVSMVPVIFFKNTGYKGVDYLSNLFRTDYITSSTVNDRPEIASNCDTINQGGDYSDKPGFPSGHTTIATFIYVSVLLEYFDKNNSAKQRENLIPILIITLLFQVLVPYARVKKGCHTNTQVAGGIVVGALMAIFTKTFERLVLLKNDTYISDKNRFLNCLSN